ncbi:MAG: 30S ribosomal protein S16 [Gammaproteobacteria bacterium]|nr:30S ribosomal protein S16 [Gammaproteobacteria bacterium]
MVVIRLARAGAKSRPFYHIVVADKRSPRDGRFIERLGYYNPLKESADSLSINLERLKHWQNTGAQASDTVVKLVKRIHKNPLLA